MTGTTKKDKWTATIKDLHDIGKIRSHQCKLYNKTHKISTGDEKCGCQRPIRQHSFDGTFVGERPKPKDWSVNEHTEPLKELIFHSTPSRKVSFSQSLYIYHYETFY
jgi:hypothetical protein